MEIFNLEEQRLLQTELSEGETILWTGKPNSKVIFHRSDLSFIPFSLMWGGFFIFWEASATGHSLTPDKNPSWFMMLWGIPFIVAGQYMIWGRFFYAAWKKSRILYALTNQRLLVIVKQPQSKTISLYLRGVTRIDKEIRADGIGTLKFGETSPPLGGRGQKKTSMDGLYLDGEIPVFVDIDDVASVATQVDAALKNAPQTIPEPRYPQFRSLA